MLQALFVAAALSGHNGTAKAVAEVTAAKSYRFTVQDGAPGAAVAGEFQQGVPLYLRADRVEFFRKGDMLVFREGEAWRRPRTGTLSDPLPILAATARARAVRPPHEELALLARALKGAKREEGGPESFTAELDAAAARELARTEDRDLTRRGSVQVSLDEKGRLTGYRITLKLQGRRGNADVDGTATRFVTVGGLGTTEVRVPPGAKRALE